MLSVDERKSKLEELLERVKRNRGRLPETTAAAREALLPESEEEDLPSPSEPSGLVSVGVKTAPVAEIEPVIDEPLAEYEPRVSVEAIETAPDEDLVEPDPFEDEAVELEPIESVVEPEHEVELIAEPEHEVELIAEPEVELDAEPEVELIAEPEVDQLGTEPVVELMGAEPPTAPESQVVAEPVEEGIRQFEATPEATGDVAVLTGQPSKEWTLNAVLDRAWNLRPPK